MWGIGRPEAPSQGTEEFKTFYQRIRAAFPDTNITVDEIVQQGDSAFARWTATMTHTGEGLPVPPTNKSLTICGMSSCRVLNGKVVETWNIWDQIGMARQLGLVQGQIAEIFP
jgi:predicted ester cyclase